MQQLALLHKHFSKELPFIPKNRLNCLMSVCNTAAHNRTLFLTGLGRNDPSQTKTSSNIERANRLLGNKHLALEHSAIYKLMASHLIPNSIRPWLHVDWSCINATTNLYVLRASVSAQGRSIVIYEECQPKKKENNHSVHKEFLTRLKSILPANAKPIIVTDAGFRAPWFKAVSQHGWDFVGRLRNKNLVCIDNAKTWKLSAQYFQQATGKPTYVGHGMLTRKEQAPIHLVLYKGKSKNRHQLNKNKKVSASGKSKRHAKSGKEPWVLVSSLSQSQEEPNVIVNIFRQRMRSEENFRDTKSPYYGLGLKNSLTRTPDRMTVLLLIGAIATFSAWFAGLITIQLGKAADFQAQSAKFTKSLSVVYLGREVIKKKLNITRAEFERAFGLLLQMVINTQLEQETYE